MRKAFCKNSGFLLQAQITRANTLKAGTRHRVVAHVLCARRRNSKFFKKAFRIFYFYVVIKKLFSLWFTPFCSIF